MLNRLTEQLDFQSRALALRSERTRLIASNIANADTPGFHARDFDFASALRQATGGADGKPAVATTDARHLAVDNSATAEPNLLYALPTQTNLDRNTVDMDQQRASFVDNAVKYEATLRFVNSGVRTMLDAMKSHNQA